MPRSWRRFETSNRPTGAQSYHPGGVFVGLADGAVRFIDETIELGNLSRPGQAQDL